MQLKPLSSNRFTRPKQEAIIDFCRQHPYNWYTTRQIQEHVFEGKLVSGRVQELLNSLVYCGYLVQDEEFNLVNHKKCRRIFVYKLNQNISKYLKTY